VGVRVEQNSHCLRGLQWDFFTEPAIEPARIVEAIERSYSGRLMVSRESWPTGTVTRLVLQFRVEFRVGEGEGRVSLIHRVSAPDDVREADRRAFAALLEGLMVGGRE